MFLHRLKIMFFECYPRESVSPETASVLLVLAPETHFARREKHKLVEETKRYSLDVVSISLTKRVELDSGWKVFYSVAETTKFAQARMGILSP